MPSFCTHNACKGTVPHVLESSSKLCVMHFTLAMEAECAEMRRETVLGHAAHDRQVEIIRYIAEHGEVSEQREFFLLWLLGKDLPGASRRRQAPAADRPSSLVAGSSRREMDRRDDACAR